MSLHPAQLWRRVLLSLAYERAWRHHRRAERIYQALWRDERAARPRAVLELLSRSEAQHARLCAGALALLNVTVPVERDPLSDRAIRWLVVRGGLRTALAWAAWDSWGYQWLFNLSYLGALRRTPGRRDLSVSPSPTPLTRLPAAEPRDK
jgi:hypothetical protein